MLDAYSDYGSVAASVVGDQQPVEEILKHHAKRLTLERLKSNGVSVEDDLVELTEGQLEYMGIGVIERRKVLARTDSLRRRRRKIDNVRERIPRDTCVNSHKRASQLFTDFCANTKSGSETPNISRLRYSTYGPLLMPLLDKTAGSIDLHTNDEEIEKQSSEKTPPVPRPRKRSLKKDEKELV